jgi:hypothetical protein
MDFKNKEFFTTDRTQILADSAYRHIFFRCCVPDPGEFTFDFHSDESKLESHNSSRLSPINQEPKILTNLSINSYLYLLIHPLIHPSNHSTTPPIFSPHSQPKQKSKCPPANPNHNPASLKNAKHTSPHPAPAPRHPTHLPSPIADHPRLQNCIPSLIAHQTINPLLFPYPYPYLHLPPLSAL